MPVRRNRAGAPVGCSARPAPLRRLRFMNGANGAHTIPLALPPAVVSALPVEYRDKPITGRTADILGAVTNFYSRTLARKDNLIRQAQQARQQADANANATVQEAAQAQQEAAKKREAVWTAIGYRALFMGSGVGAFALGRFLDDGLGWRIPVPVVGWRIRPSAPITLACLSAALVAPALKGVPERAGELFSTLTVGSASAFFSPLFQFRGGGAPASASTSSSGAEARVSGAPEERVVWGR